MIRGKRPIRSEDARLETNDTIITDAVAIKLCSVDIWQSPLLATRPGHAEYIYIYIYIMYIHTMAHIHHIYIYRVSASASYWTHRITHHN